MSAAGQPVTAQQQAQAAVQANALARSLITSRAIKMTQNIYSNVINPQNTQLVQIPIRQVGLVIGWWVELAITVADPGSGNGYGLTPFGPANVLNQIVLTDLNNNVRIQTAGWHLHFVNSAKKRRPFCAARTNTAYPISYGANWTTTFAAETITHDAQPTVYMLYWVPCAYSDYDLRGAIYMNVVNATAYLQLQIATSAQAFVAAGADPTLAVYQANLGAPTSGWGTSCTINVYQVYYDQLPTANGQVVLPYTDLSAIYEIKTIGAQTGMTTGQDFPIPYSNFRDFLSTFVVWDNGGTLDTGQFTNYWALQSANFTNIFKEDPGLIAMQSRNEIGDDFPNGVYYFASRDKPISTVQFGNMALVLNPTGTINAGAQLLVGYEDFALVNTLVGAASLQTNA
jgi:hypothetical protein